MATAAYGSDTESHVKLLRDFRDKILVNSELGKTFISIYSRVSPRLAAFISRHEILRVAVRWGLLPLMGVSWMALYLGILPTLVLLILLVVILGSSAVVLLKRMGLHRDRIR